MPRKQQPKRRANGSGSVYLDGDQWIVRYEVDTEYGATITRRERQPRGTTRDQAQARADDLAAHRRTLLNKRSVQDVIERWLDEGVDKLGRPWAQGTKDTYRNYLTVHVLPRIGHLDLYDLNEAHCYALRAAIQKEMGRGAKTVWNVFLAALKAAERRYKQPVAFVSPAKDILLGVDDAPEREPLTIDQIRSLFDLLEREPVYQQVIQEIFAGALRVSEAVGIAWPNLTLDGDAPVLYVSQQLYTRSIQATRPIDPKTKKSRRRIYLSEASVARYRQRRAQQLSDRMLAGAAWDNPFDLVFTYPNGRHLTPGSIRYRLHAVEAQIGYRNLTPHVLRHTMNTLLLEHGLPRHLVMLHLGHENEQTNQTYTHSTIAGLRQTAAAADLILNEIRKKA